MNILENPRGSAHKNPIKRQGKTATTATPISDASMYYSSIDGQIMRGMSGGGVPVCSAAGAPVAALSVAAISPRLERARRERIVTIVKAGAKRMEAALAPLLGQTGGQIQGQRKTRKKISRVALIQILHGPPSDGPSAEFNSPP